MLADVKRLDLEQRVVHALAADGRMLSLPYDTLVLAAGATHAHFGRAEWAEFAPGMKTLEDARHLRSHILSAFEMAEVATDPAERARYLTFVVVGAGPTGVELVGQVAELAHKVLPREYRSVDTARGIRFTGVIGYTMWGFIHVLSSAGGNRLGAMYNWARALTFTRGRPHRVIAYEAAHYELTQEDLGREFRRVDKAKLPSEVEAAAPEATEVISWRSSRRP